MRLRYGVEPPVLVKLEKEIEMEETLLLTEEPPPAVKTFSVCCQHGGLYQAGVSSVMKQTRYEVFHLEAKSVASFSEVAVFGACVVWIMILKGRVEMRRCLGI